MGLFKKNKEPDNTPDVKNEPKNDAKGSEKGKSGNNRKKSELLRCLDESVWESVLADFKANKKFIITDEDGSKRYVGLLFDTMSVGGLVGKDAKKDESKGSALEAIRTSRIKAYIRNEMLLDDSFIIVPDKDSLANMDEFMFFKNAKFILCTIDADGQVRSETQNGSDDDNDPEITLTYDEVRDMVNDDNRAVDEWFISQKAAKEASKVVAEPQVDIPPVDVRGMEPNYNVGGGDNDEDIEELPDDFDDVAPSGSTPINMNTPSGNDYDNQYDDGLNGPDMGYGAPAQDYGQPQGYQQPDQPYYNNGYEQPQQFYGDSYEQQDDGGYDEYSDITPEILNDFVVRKFYSSDLGLEISAEPFDVQFVHNNQYIPFNTNRGTGWLNEYLNNFSKDANTRMERLHQSNIYTLRTQYMSAIQHICSEIDKSLSTADDSTQFGKIFASIEQNRAENMQRLDESIQAKREQLEETWNAKLDMVAQDAANAARKQYVLDYGKGHENDIFNLETREKDEIERDYNNAMRRMNEDRRNEASKLLDAGINETLSNLSKVYLQMLQAEKLEYSRLQNEMTRFIDSNRKDEKASIEALAENNRQVKQANEVRKDYAAKMKAMAAEFDMKKVALQAEIEEIHRHNDSEIKKYNEEWDSKSKAYEDKIATLEADLQQSREEYMKLHDTMEADYGKRIEDLNAELALREDNMGHVIETHKRSNMAIIFGGIAAIIAAIGIGFIIGTWISVNSRSKLEQESVYYNTYQNNGTNVEDITDNGVDGSKADDTDDTTINVITDVLGE